MVGRSVCGSDIGRWLLLLLIFRREKEAISLKLEASWRRRLEE
jgi:hypothetical protein